MSVTDDELKLAEARSAAARQRLTGTLLLLQNKLNPRVLAADAAEELREKALQIFDEGVAAAKARPGMAAGVVAMIVAYLFRGPIFNAICAAIKHMSETRVSDRELNAQAISKAALRAPAVDRKKERGS